MTSAAENTPESIPENTSTPETWHIVKKGDGHCDIVDHQELAQLSDNPQTWGPFSSRTEAIAKRVGLIRAGKCMPH